VGAVCGFVDIAPKAGVNPMVLVTAATPPILRKNFLRLGEEAVVDESI
jgi:hypothetical protein